MNNTIKELAAQVDRQLSSYTTQQLKDAMAEFAKMDELEAYQLAFCELHARLGDEAFDSFCDEMGV